MNWRKILAALVTKATCIGSTTHAYKSKRKRRKYVSKHVTENKAQMANIDTKRGASRPQTSDGGKATPCWQGRRAAHRALRLPGKTARGGLMQPRACALDARPWTRADAPLVPAKNWDRLPAPATERQSHLSGHHAEVKTSGLR